MFSIYVAASQYGHTKFSGFLLRNYTGFPSVCPSICHALLLLTYHVLLGTLVKRSRGNVRMDRDDSSVLPLNGTLYIFILDY